MKLLFSCLIILVLLQLTSCFDSKDSAQKQLERRGYRYSIPQFLEAASTGNHFVLALFGKAGMDPNATDPDGNSALIAASEQGHATVVQMLLGAGATPHHRDNRGRNALIGAAFGGHPKIIALLQLRGVDETVKDKKGWTALSIAAYKGNTEAVRLLVKSASPEQLNEAFRLASQNKNAEVMALLREQEAREKSAEDEILRAATRAADLPAQRKLVSSQEAKPLVALNGSTIQTPHPGKPVMESFFLTSYRKQELPITFCEVNGNHAVFQLTDSRGQVQKVNVLRGALIPETRYRLDKIESTDMETGNRTQGKMARVRIQNVATGANHLLAKEAGTGAADVCGIVTAQESAYRYVAKRGDLFRTRTPNRMEREFQVVEVRPTGVMVKDLTSDKGYTLPQLSAN